MYRYDLTMIDYERLENIEEEKQKYDDLKDDLKQVEVMLIKHMRR